MVREKLLGPDHPDTLATRQSLAWVLADRGDLDAAEAEYRDVLITRERVLGLDHWDTQRAAPNLAHVRSRRQDKARAETNVTSRNSQATQERHTEFNNRYTWYTRSNVARLLRVDEPDP